MRMTYILATGLFLTAGLAAPAAAGTVKPTDVKTTISAEMLSTQDGIKKVYQKLGKTAENSCQNTGANTLTNRAYAKRCETRLLNSFIADVGHDGLTAYHKDMTKR